MLTPVTRLVYESSRPVHMHRCPGVSTNDESPHEWGCDSPYCEQIYLACPKHGGAEPVAQGQEPWRGR